MSKGGQMKRRDFLKAAAGSALALHLPLWLNPAGASTLSAGAPLLLCFNAKGGWDPTIHCDPHAHEDYTRFSEADIGHTTTGIPYAPQRIAFWDGDNEVDQHYMVRTSGEQRFFEKYANELLVINGIDAQTVSHDVGSRNTWSGSAREGNPAIGALVANVYGSTQPLAFLTTGGFDATAGLVTATRSGNIDALLPLIHPYTHKDESANLVPASIQSHIAEAQALRLQRQLERTHLGRRQAVLNELDFLRSHETALAPLLDQLSALEAFGIPAPADNGLNEHVRLTVASMMAGLSTSAQFTISQFDTHQDHFDMEDGQRSRLRKLFEAQDYAIELLKAAGLYERAIFMMGSDFGRTHINNDEELGKDHWSVTSMMLMGAGISGGRSIGRTTVEPGPKGVTAWRVHPETLEPTEDTNTGLFISPAHIHKALRAAIGAIDHPAAQQFPLEEVEALPLFQ